jgi:hypothetical protein
MTISRPEKPASAFMPLRRLPDYLPQRGRRERFDVLNKPRLKQRAKGFEPSTSSLGSWIRAIVSMASRRTKNCLESLPD